MSPKTALALSSLVVGTALIMNVIYKYMKIRYGFIIVSSIVFIVERKKIIAIIHGVLHTMKEKETVK